MSQSLPLCQFIYQKSPTKNKVNADRMAQKQIWLNFLIVPNMGGKIWLLVKTKLKTSYWCLLGVAWENNNVPLTEHATISLLCFLRHLQNFFIPPSLTHNGFLQSLSSRRNITSHFTYYRCCNGHRISESLIVCLILWRKFVWQGFSHKLILLHLTLAIKSEL